MRFGALVFYSATTLDHPLPGNPGTNPGLQWRRSYGNCHVLGIPNFKNFPGKRYPRFTVSRDPAKISQNFRKFRLLLKYNSLTVLGATV